MAYGWEGKSVRLVPLDAERHLENCLRWVNDPEITGNLLIGDFPMGRLEERAWFEGHELGKRDDVSLAIETLDGRHIGMSGIHAIDWRNGSAVTGTFIGSKDDWGKGHGTDAALTRNRYAFEVLGLRLLLSGCLAGNERSFRMLQRAGYIECGRIPKRYWKRGEYRDEIKMYLLREDWLEKSSLGAS